MQKTRPIMAMHSSIVEHNNSNSLFDFDFTNSNSKKGLMSYNLPWSKRSSAL